MGARLWHQIAPWNPDAAVALDGVQAQFVQEIYNLPEYLNLHYESARKALEITRAEGDKYGLLEIYESQFELMERLISEPIPDDAKGRIAIVREVSEMHGEGVGNLLDLTKISDSCEPFAAWRLSTNEIKRLTGNIRPTYAMVERALGSISDEIGRGESVCFPIYDTPTDAVPAGWIFIGNTVD